MLSEPDESEIQKMIGLAVNHFQFYIIEPKLKKLEKRLTDLLSEL